MNRSNSLSSTTDSPCISAWQILGELALVALALTVAYFFCVGVIATSISQGWVAA